jgi:4-amino-4-deoxy-L-arabinose transferase-like glycosyltransferase
MTAAARIRTNAALAVLTGLGLRLFFVLKFPVTESGDSPFYLDLAWNWLKNGVYGFSVNGTLTPVDMRVPGYPAFLAAVFAFAGKSPRAAMVTQAVVDVAGCFVIALIAARLAPESSRRRVALAALWLAALCPFTANYSAVILTEVLVTFLTGLAILALFQTDLGVGKDETRAPLFINHWFLGGIIVGFGTLVRPETPLLLLAAGLVLIARWWRPSDWPELLRAGVLTGVGLLLPLVPWAARNWSTLHDVQFLAPRYSELPGEYTPLGFISWTNTWLWRVRDVYLVAWKANAEEIPLEDIPASSFDSPSEKERFADVLEQYNESLTIGPKLDTQFREIAHARARQHPLRTYITIPLLRSFTLWFSPRVELLPYSGRLLPLGDEWRDDRKDFVVTLILISVSLFYLALALAGAWLARRRPGWALLISFILVRTAFIVYFVDTPEPRYVLECFPAVIALAAQPFAGRRQLSSTGSG